MTSQATDNKKPTPEEKDIIADFVKHLKLCGFCKLDSVASNQTQLYNRFSCTALPMSYIDNAFSAWLFKQKKTCNFRSSSYITYTLPHVVGSKFIPDSGEYYTCPNSGLQYVNTYKKYKPKTNSRELSPLVHEYFERLFPVATERHTVLQWLAHIFVRPSERPSWHLMFSSDVGVGKGVLVNEILQPLLLHTSVLNSYSKLMGKFSTVLEETLLCLLDDPKAKSDDVQTQLKSLLSEERAYIERKGLQGGMITTYTRFILASNETRPLFLESNERRWFVVTPLVHKIDATETAAFIKKLVDWLALEGSLDALHHFFMSYDLTGFNPKRIEQTESLKAMIVLSANPDLDFIKQVLEDNKVCTNAELMQAFKDDGRTPPSSKQVPHLLRELGLESRRIDLKEFRKSVILPVGMSNADALKCYKNNNQF